MMSTLQRLNELEHQSKHLTNHIHTSDVPPLDRGLGEIASGSQRFAASTIARSENIVRQSLGPENRGASIIEPSLITAAIDNKASQLLSRKGQGFDLEKVRRTLKEINLSQSLESLSGLRDTDVDGYLQNEYQNMILVALQETKIATEGAAHAQFELLLNRDRDAIRSKLLLDHGQHRPPSEYSADPAFSTLLDNKSPLTLTDRFGKTVNANPSVYEQQEQSIINSESITGIKSLRSQSKMNAYVTVVEALNGARVSGKLFDLCGAFYTAIKQVRIADPSAKLIQRCWSLLFQIIENDNARLGQQKRTPPSILEYFEAYHAPNSDSKSKVFRQQIADRSRKFFETTYKQWLSEYVRSHRSELGGSPSSTDEVREFVRLRKPITGKEVEYINDEPFWAQLWTYIRCGMYSEAVTYTHSFSEHLKQSAPGFSEIFPEWVKNKSKGLIGQSRYKIKRTWEDEMKHRVNEVDRFKFAIYKIIARCDLSHSTLACMETAEDHIWMLLLQVQETPTDSYAIQDRLGLQDVADTVLRVGLTHYKNPLVWFQMLLACGEFEVAISELAQFDNFFADAVHFSICLSYYGMLRVLPYAVIQQQKQLNTRLTSEIISADFKSRKDLLYNEETIKLISERQYKVQDICYEKLIRLIVLEFEKDQPLQALHYVFTLTLTPNRKLPASLIKDNIVMNSEAQNVLRDIILKSRAYKELLGVILDNGKIAPGYIYKYRNLVGISTEHEFNNEIISKTAEQALSLGYLVDSIHLENLAGGYEKIINMLISQMTQELLQIRHTRQRTQSQQSTSKPILLVETKRILTKQGEIISLAEQVTSYYDTVPTIKAQIASKSLWTCQLLAQFLLFFRHIISGDNELALDVIRKTEIFPITNRLDEVQSKSDIFRQLDARAARFIPDTLVAVGEALSGLRNELQHSSSKATTQTGLSAIKSQAEALLLYTASLGYSVQADTLGRIQRLFNVLCS